MSEQEEYLPTSEDQAIMVRLATGMVIGRIQNLYAEGKYNLETYNALYNVAREADTQVGILLDTLETARTVFTSEEVKHETRVDCEKYCD